MVFEVNTRFPLVTIDFVVTVEDPDVRHRAERYWDQD
jgi:hypothetical protein